MGSEYIVMNVTCLSVCMFVCPHAYFGNYMYDFHACYLYGYMGGSVAEWLAR